MNGRLAWTNAAVIAVAVGHNANKHGHRRAAQNGNIIRVMQYASGDTFEQSMRNSLSACSQTQPLVIAD